MEKFLYHFNGVQKLHGKSFVLDLSDFRISHGQVLGLLGPTGAGKSTLLRLLAFLESPDRGNIYFDDQHVNSNNIPLATRRRITLVHQRPVLLSGSVRFNVEYGLRLRKVKRPGAVDCMLERLGLIKIAQQPAHTLSGGQMQLAALARALVLEPDVLLLDEPTANLDPAHVALVEQVIQEIQQQRRISVIWATHNVFQARRVSNQAALLLNGQLIEAAATEVFFHSPSDPRTTDFVQGRMIY